MDGQLIVFVNSLCLWLLSNQNTNVDVVEWAQIRCKHTKESLYIYQMISANEDNIVDDRAIVDFIKNGNSGAPFALLRIHYYSRDHS